MPPANPINSGAYPHCKGAPFGLQDASEPTSRTCRERSSTPVGALSPWPGPPALARIETPQVVTKLPLAMFKSSGVIKRHTSRPCLRLP
ncbi:hypothetical protein Taro_007191, partial [Colocasia esculenta]|nr:hypothetical protein [Colocasia esculenta]